MKRSSEYLSEQTAVDQQNEVETYVIPDSPDDSEEDENQIYQLMNSQLDKQIAEDMEAIRKYISKNEDSFSKRIEFFNNIDNSYINRCIDKTVNNHIFYQHTVLGTIKWHECAQCEFRAREKDKVKEHVLQKHPKMLFTCPHCEFVVRRRGDLLKHLSIVHRENSNGFKCDKCKASFVRNYHLLRHLRLKHDATVFLCNKCDYASLDENEKRQHVMAEHIKLNVSWYKCAQCAYRTVKKINLEKHIMYKHSIF